MLSGARRSLALLILNPFLIVLVLVLDRFRFKLYARILRVLVVVLRRRMTATQLQDGRGMNKGNRGPEFRSYYRKRDENDRERTLNSVNRPSERLGTLLR